MLQFLQNAALTFGLVLLFSGLITLISKVKFLFALGCMLVVSGLGVVIWGIILYCITPGPEALTPASLTWASGSLIMALGVICCIMTKNKPTELP